MFELPPPEYLCWSAGQLQQSPLVVLCASSMHAQQHPRAPALTPARSFAPVLAPEMRPSPALPSVKYDFFVCLACFLI
jgi:hypothetical protein